MGPARTAAALLLVFMFASSGAGPRAAEPSRPGYAGQPLADALADLQTRGLRLIFTSDLVDPSMVVGVEPGGATLRQILDELIAPFGLESRDGPGATVLIVRPPRAAAGPGGIAGTVLTLRERRPVAAARIVVAGTGVWTVSGHEGDFAIKGLPAGTYVIEVEVPGLATGRFPGVSVTAGGTTEVTLHLTIRPGMLEQVVVTPSRYTIAHDQPEVRQILTNEEIDRMAQLGGDLSRAVVRLPGATGGDKSAEMNLRGGERAENLVLLDGMQIDEPFHLKDFLSVSGIVDSRAIGSVDLLTGAFPVEYSDRMSGVMDLTSSAPGSTGGLVIGSSLINSSVLADGPLPGGAGGWLVTGRAWYPDAVLDIVDPGGDDINPRYYDLMGKAELRLGADTLLSGHILAAHDAIAFIGEESDERVEARYDSRYAWFNLRSFWSSHLISRTVFSAGRVSGRRSGDADDGEGNVARVDDRRAYEVFGFKQDWTYRSSERSLFKWGAVLRRTRADYDYLGHSEISDPIFGGGGPPTVIDRASVLHPSANQYGVYVAERFRPVAPLTIEVGVRRDRQTQTADGQTSPRFNLAYAWGERTALRAGWGRFHQSQRLDELQVEDGVDRFFPAQLAEHRVVGIERSFEGGARLRVDVYEKRMSHLRPRFENLFNPIEIFPEAEPDRIRIAPDTARARGVEIFFKSAGGGPFAWWAAYALATVEDEFGGARVPRSWDQRHTVNFSLNLRPGMRWNVNLAGVYRSGWPTTGVDATTVTNPDGSTTVQPILGDRNEERYPAYHRLDLKASRLFTIGRGSLTLYAEITNLLDRDNVCCVEDFIFEPQPDGTVQVEGQNGFWLRRQPSIGLIWTVGR